MKSTKLNKVSYNPYEKLSKTSLATRTLIEAIPFGLGPYGIGDLISLYEGVKGQMIFGPKLDMIDRIISFIAACIPIVPATPFRLFAAKVRGNLS
jgi:hypothetical protein